MFAGILLGGALAMTWVNPPKENEESPFMPLGGPTEITVYDRVVVGSDGTPTSLKTVRRAAAVASAADAQLVVVSAYTPESQIERTATGKRVPNVRQLLYGEEAARAALRTSVNELSNERVRNTETRIVEGGPAEALLEVAGSNPANVIVVGNRGLGAADGQLLGSVPGEVAKNAAYDVLIVQTGEAEDDPVASQNGEPSGDRVT
jgi:maltose/moltooligosaccharide transporter